MTPIPLSSAQSTLDKLLDGDVFGFGLDVMTSAVPAPILAVIVFGTIGGGYYMTQRSLAIPLVMATLIGGVTITRFPVQFQQGILSVFIIFIAGIGFLLLQRVRA
jgi:hypothetical protein